MKIVIGEYELIPDGTRFDLVWNKPGKKRIFTEENGERKRIDTDEDIIIRTELGYSMHIESCLRSIIRRNVSAKNEGLSLTLEEYLKEYVKEEEKVTNLFKEVFKLKLKENGSI